MLKRFKGKAALSKALAWQAAMWVALFAAVSMMTLLWLSGFTDTKEAIDSGRRLVAMVETGEIVGKLNSAAPAPVDALNPEEQKLEDAKPEAAAPELPTPETPAAEPAPAEAPKIEAPPNPDAAPAVPEAAPEPKAEAPVEPPTAEDKIVPGEELPIAHAPEDVDVPEESVTIVPSAHPLPDVKDTLVEKKEQGLLPAIAADGTKSWQYYAKPFERKGKEPMIAVIIAGLGQAKGVTEKALVLPENFTLSFSPYGKDVEKWAQTARLTAHEKLVDLPMEASNYPAADPGPYGLILAKGLQENETRLQWLMSRFTGHIGFLTPQDEVYTANDEALKVMLQSLANRGLMLVVGHEPARTETKEMLETTSTPNVIADMLVDEELLDTSIDTRLNALEQLAVKRGYAVGIVQATPLSLERLKQWVGTLEGKGIVLVPVSAVAKLRFS